MNVTALDHTLEAEAIAGDGMLKLIELELALGAEDIRTEGFEASVRNACEASEVEFLFNLPVFDPGNTQRVAAVGWRTAPGTEPLFAFVTLDADGATVNIDKTCDCLERAPDVARAWFDLMTH